MESKDELKEVGIKNCNCYYVDDIISDIDFDFDKILLHEKSYKNKYENILIYDILYKTLIGAKPLRIRFDKIDGFIKTYDGIRYLVSFNHGRCEKICDRIKYLISEKSGISDSINHNFARVRIYSYNSFPISKILTFHNVIILIATTIISFKKKSSYKDKSNTQNF